MFSYSGDKQFDRFLTLLLCLTAFSVSSAKYQGKAPYGRFGNANKLVSLDPRFGWWLMELPATLFFVYGFRTGYKKEQENKKDLNLISKILGLIWLRHYANRGWYFPLTIRVADGGAMFLSMHGYLNGRMFTDVGSYTDRWLRDPRFIIGMIVYEMGFWTTLHSESILRNLRPRGQTVSDLNRYKIPYGGLFKYVTNPQYFGEIVAWLGFLTLTWSPTAIPVVFITMSNLVPRSFENHKWYLEKFQKYPKNRKVLVPFII